MGRAPILRITGKLKPVGDEPLGESDMRMLLYSIMSSRQRTIYELEREVDFALALENGQRFRECLFSEGSNGRSTEGDSFFGSDAETLQIPETVLQLGDRARAAVGGWTDRCGQKHHNGLFD